MAAEELTTRTQPGSVVDKAGPVSLPLATVVVITRNRAQSLARTLKALSRLDDPAFEVVVVDNGSTDATQDVVERYGARYFFSSPAAGISRSRQKGVDQARGEVIAMCDDDCIPHPDWLRHLVERLLTEEDLGLLAGQVVNVGFHGVQPFKGRSKLVGPNGKMEQVEDPAEATFFGNANLAFRRQTMRAVGGYDPFLIAGRAEYDLAMTIRHHGLRVDYEPRAVVEHHFTGVNYKRGRFFYDHHLMRLYFHLKHFRPTTAAAWWRFVVDELVWMGQDLWRAARAIAAATLRRRWHRWPALVVEVANLFAARLAVPWLLWRLRRRGRRHRCLFP